MSPSRERDPPLLLCTGLFMFLPVKEVFGGGEFLKAL